MRDISCKREDVINAFEDLCHRLERRRGLFWNAYLEAVSDLVRSEYEDVEHECWFVLEFGLSGINAEERMLQRDFEQRLAIIDESEESVA